MRLCNISVGGEIHVGIVTADGVIDATAAGFCGVMDGVIAGKGLDELRKLEKAPLPAVDAPEYADVVNRAGKLLCVGLNYRAHASNMDMGSVQEYPVLFSKFPDALTRCGAAVELPDWESSYDYEAELVVVMGRTAWGVDEKDAMDCVFGYTCGNDLSCRVPQKRSGQWLIGKTMPGFAPCGPCIVTADSFDPSACHGVKSYVNGRLRQDGSTSDMIFDCAKIISYASRYTRLEPGDLIFTGTPSGVAAERIGAEQWLKPGDRVDVVIDGIGTLSNTMK